MNSEDLDITVVELAYGCLKVPICFPSDRILGVMRPVSAELPSSASSEVKLALDNPLGASRLEDSVVPGMNVVIMASDITRPSPSKILVPPLLKRLKAAGISDDDVTIVLGMGIHRNHTVAEKERLVGREIF